MVSKSNETKNSSKTIKAIPPKEGSPMYKFHRAMQKILSVTKDDLKKK